MVLEISVVVVAVYALYKHYGLAKLESAVETEVANLEAAAVKVEADAKADYASIVTRLKALL